MSRYEFKGTKGEWIAHKEESYMGYSVHLKPEGWQFGTAYIAQDIRQPNTGEADAHLIAAAPDLLQACIDIDDNNCTVGDSMRALADLMKPKMGEEKDWIKWLNDTANKIDAAIYKSLNIETK